MKALEKLVTKRLYLVPLKLELLKAAIISIDELTTILGVKVAAEWADQEFIQAFPDIANILLQFPLQNEWGWGSLIIHQTENTLIGHVMIKIIPDVTGLPTDAVEIGYQVAPLYRRQGYASGALRRILNSGFCQRLLSPNTSYKLIDNGLKSQVKNISIRLDRRH